MSNEEYREELRKIFDRIDENYVLAYFYVYMSERLKQYANMRSVEKEGVLG